MTEKPKDPSSETEVRIYSLATMMTESIIFLEEINGNRLLPIWIGTVEGQAIAIRFSGIVLPRPLTHDLTLSIIKTLGFTVEKIIITDLKENTFYASIYVKNGGAVHIIDSRPSDALAIAVRAGCSIFICSRIVTPSFVTTISPKESTNILSIPFGPKVVLTVSATNFAAMILFLCASLPEVLCESGDIIYIG